MESEPCVLGGCDLDAEARHENGATVCHPHAQDLVEWDVTADEEFQPI